MILPVLAALTGPAEARLVAGLAEHAGRVSVVRRPADIIELVAAAEAGVGRAAVIADDFPGLEVETVVRLHAAGVRVVAVGDEPDALTALGVDDIVETGADADRVAAALLAGPPPVPDGRDSGAPHPESAVTAGRRTGWEDLAGRSGTAREAPAAVITVWGTGGAPGRTTLAVNLAAELAATGNRTLLIDADSYGACAGAVLGLLDESAGLATVCRLAGRGTLDDVGLRTASSGITETLSVLTGITQSSRWPELTRARLAAVFDTARACADVVVIDCAAPIEQDEELSYDTDAPQRNAATLTAIDAADLTLLVGTADPIGLGRLVRAYADAADGLDTDVVPVVNGLRTRVVGSPAKARVTDALARFAGIDSPTMLPYDRAACDDALLRGVTLREADRRGSAARAIAALAVDLAAWLSIPGSRGAEPGRRRPAQ